MGAANLWTFIGFMAETEAWEDELVSLIDHTLPFCFACVLIHRFQAGFLI